MAKVKNQKDGGTLEKVTATDTLNLNPAFMSRAKREEARQQSLMAKQLQDDMLRMKNDELFPDLQFVSDSQSFAGHKIIIKSRSHNAVSGDWFETPSGGPPRVCLHHTTLGDCEAFLNDLYTLDEVGPDFVMGGLKGQHQTSPPRSATDEAASQSETHDINRESGALHERQSLAQDVNTNATSPSQADRETHHQDCETSGPADTLGSVAADHETEGNREVKDGNAVCPTRTDIQPRLVGEMSHGERHKSETTDQDLSFPLPSQATNCDTESENQTPGTAAETVSHDLGAGNSPGYNTSENGHADEIGTDSIPGHRAISTDKAIHAMETTGELEAQSSADTRTFPTHGTSESGHVEKGTNDVPAQGSSGAEHSHQKETIPEQALASADSQTSAVHGASQNGCGEQGTSDVPEVGVVVAVAANAQQELDCEQKAGSSPDPGSASRAEPGLDSQGTPERTDPEGVSAQDTALDSEPSQAAADKSGSVETVPPPADQADKGAGLKEKLDESGGVEHSGILVTDGTEGASSSLALESALSQSQEAAGGGGIQSDVAYKPCSKLAADLLRCYLSADGADCCLRVNGDTFLAHKCILVARCQYFDAMFAGSWCESEEMEIKLHGVKAQSVKYILLFLYGAMVEVPVADITSVIQASDMFGMEGLKEWLCFLLARDLCHFFHKPCQDCTRMVPDVLVVASQFNLIDLSDRARRWVATHFRRIWETQTFGTLPAPMLEECVKAVIDQMSVQNITQVILDTHDLTRCLQRNHRSEQVQIAAIQILDEALAFCAHNFPTLVASPSFLSWSKGGAWCMDVLEESYTMVVSLLQPEVACEVYSSLRQLLATSEAETEDVRIYSSDEVRHLLKQLVERCEWYLHRYIHRVMQCPQWTQLPSAVQQELLQKSSYVPVHAATAVGAQSRAAQKSAKAMQDNIVHTVSMLCETNPDLFPTLSQTRKILSNSNSVLQQQKKPPPKKTDRRASGSSAASKPVVGSDSRGKAAVKSQPAAAKTQKRRKAASAAAASDSATPGRTAPASLPAPRTSATATSSRTGSGRLQSKAAAPSASSSASAPPSAWRPGSDGTVGGRSKGHVSSSASAPPSASRPGSAAGTVGGQSKGPVSSSSRAGARSESAVKSSSLQGQGEGEGGGSSSSAAPGHSSATKPGPTPTPTPTPPPPSPPPGLKSASALPPCQSDSRAEAREKGGARTKTTRATSSPAATTAAAARPSSAGSSKSRESSASQTARSSQSSSSPASSCTESRRRSTGTKDPGVESSTPPGERSAHGSARAKDSGAKSTSPGAEPPAGPRRRTGQAGGATAGRRAAAAAQAKGAALSSLSSSSWCPGSNSDRKETGAAARPRASSSARTGSGQTAVPTGAHSALAAREKAALYAVSLAGPSSARRSGKPAAPSSSSCSSSCSCSSSAAGSRDPASARKPATASAGFRSAGPAPGTRTRTAGGANASNAASVGKAAAATATAAARPPSSSARPADGGDNPAVAAKSSSSSSSSSSPSSRPAPAAGARGGAVVRAPKAARGSGRPPQTPPRPTAGACGPNAGQTVASGRAASPERRSPGPSPATGKAGDTAKASGPEEVACGENTDGQPGSPESATPKAIPMAGECSVPRAATEVTAEVSDFEERSVVVASGEKTVVGSDETVVVGSAEKAAVDSNEKTVVGSDEKTVVGSDEKTVIVGSDEKTVVGSDEKTVVGSDEMTVVGSDEKTVDGSDEKTVVGSDEKTVVGSDEKTVVGSDEKTVDGSDEKTVVGSEEMTVAGCEGKTVVVDTRNEVAAHGEPGVTVWTGETEDTVTPPPPTAAVTPPPPTAAVTPPPPTAAVTLPPPTATVTPPPPAAAVTPPPPTAAVTLPPPTATEAEATVTPPPPTATVTPPPPTAAVTPPPPTAAVTPPPPTAAVTPPPPTAAVTPPPPTAPVTPPPPTAAVTPPPPTATEAEPQTSSPADGGDGASPHCEQGGEEVKDGKPATLESEPEAHPLNSF